MSESVRENAKRFNNSSGNQEITTAARDERISQAVAEFLVAAEVGDTDRSALLSKYSDVADDVERCLETFDFVNNVAPQLASTSMQADQPSSSSISPVINLGDFRIIRELGRGGMGVVYEAEQLSLGRRMALKVLPFAAMLDRQQLKRFKNEARAAASLEHPNIVAVHSVGEERGVHYYAMQLVEGQSLAEVVSQLRTANGAGLDNGTKEICAERRDVGPSEAASADECGVGLAQRLQTSDTQREVQAAISTVPTFDTKEYLHTVARLGMQASLALDHAHRNGVLHRDIKPGNLLVDVEGKLWVTDFGLARMECDASMTMTGDLLGTLAYMSPEQALAKRVVVDHRTDIYSLGATLYELLTLRPPYKGENRQELLKQIAFDEVRRPRLVNNHIPTDLDTIILKALEKNPEDRYTTASDFADDLQRYLSDQPIRARVPKFRQRLSKWSRRHQGLVVSAIAFMTFLLFAVTIGTAIIWKEKTRAHVAYEWATEQKLLAEQSDAESEALVDFLVNDLLGSIDPERALGKTITVEEVVNEAERTVDRHLQDQPLLEAAIRCALAEIHLSLGNPDHAEQHVLRAFAIQQRLLGTDDAKTLKTMDVLEDVYHEQGRLLEATTLQEKIVKLSRRLKGEEHPFTLEQLHELGTNLADQRILARAEPLLRDTLDSMQQVLGIDAEETLSVQHDLAFVALLRGKNDEARQLLEASLETCGAKRGNEHPQTQALRLALAKCLYEFFNEHEVARPLFDEVIQVRTRIYGATHPETCEAIRMLLDLLTEQGETMEALTGARKMHQQLVDDLGRESPHTLRAQLQVGVQLAYRSDFDEAIKLAKDVVNTLKRNLGPQNARSLEAMESLSDIYRRAEYTSDERALRREIFAIRKQALGPDNPHTLQAASRWAGLLTGNVRLSVIEDTLNRQRRVLGSEHYRTLESACRVAEAYEAQNRLREAEDRLREVAAIQRRVLGSEARGTLVSELVLAHVLMRQNENQEARDLLVRIDQAYQTTTGADFEDAQTTKLWLALSESRLGNYDEAIRLQREVLADRASVYGKQAPFIASGTRKLAEMFRLSGNHEEARRTFEAILPTLEQLEGPDGVQVLKAQRGLALTLWSLGQLDRAATMVGELAETYQRLNDESTARQAQGALLEILKERARLRSGERNWAAAATDWAKVVELSDEKLTGWDSPRKRTCRELSKWPEVRRHVTELMPNETTIWVGSGQYHALRGLWKEADSDYSRVIADRPIGDETFEGIATALLAKDQSAYEQLCRELLDRPNEPGNPFAAYVVARTCAIGAFPNVDSQQLILWAEQRLKQRSTSAEYHVLGLCQFRAGRLEDAIMCLERSNAEGTWPNLAKAQNWLVLAMAWHQMGDNEKALQSWTNAKKIITADGPKQPGEPTNIAAPDWIAIALLRREAESLFSDHDPSDSKDRATTDGQPGNGLVSTAE